MKKEVISMSEPEIDRLTIIQSVIDKRLKQKHASQMLNISPRQIKRLVKAFKTHGAIALVSKQRGKRSNRSYSESFKNKVTDIIREQYPDFGPTLACEKLAIRNDIHICIETTRQFMIQGGIWKANIKRRKVVHSPRMRRSCWGELIQIDGSHHDWFEGRAPECTLIVFIDDATSRIQLIRFFEEETTFAYFSMIKLYIERYGKPVGLYSDRLGVFKVNMIEPLNSTGLTQFGRAMQSLDIDLIYAYSAQAKGRVERANETLQDRLVKELRLCNISDMETANQFLDEYTKKHNDAFAISPKDSTDVHRVMNNQEILDICLTHQETRKIHQDMTIRYKNRIYKIEGHGKGNRLIRAQVTVCEAESGKITLLYKGESLSYTVYDKNQQNNEIASKKEIRTHLKPVKSQNYKPKPNHPWKSPPHQKYIRLGFFNKEKAIPIEGQNDFIDIWENH